MYQFHNANALGNFVNDCTVRAISVAEGKSWDTTYDELSELAQEKGTLLDDVRFIEDYLDERYSRVKFKSTYVGELCEEFPKGTYLVTMRNHISLLKDGTIYDTFDCRDKFIWSVWEVKEGLID